MSSAIPADMPIAVHGPENSPFLSFWQAGFEGADHRNGSGDALNLVKASGHAAQVDGDYQRLHAFGIRSVRESVGWRSATCDGGTDFSSVVVRAAAARRHGIQILWTVLHYGVPPEVDFGGRLWVDRFANFCRDFVRVLQRFDSAAPLVLTIINEPSFLAWAYCRTGLIGGVHVTTDTDAFEMKKNLVAAILAACRSILSEFPHTRFVHVDPLVHVDARKGDDPHQAALINDHQFQCWNMICGREAPELGGTAEYLDRIGVNYYHANQWEVPTEERLHWHLRDPRRRSFDDLLCDLHCRYDRPIVVSETGHVGSGKALWLTEVAKAVASARRRGVPVEGLCLYPVIDRPDWERPEIWHRCGLWSVDHTDPELPRHLDTSLAHALKRAQADTPPASGLHRPATKECSMRTLIVYSHLRWDFVYQRPQHLLAALSDRWRILYVEEPVFVDHGPAVLERLNPLPNVEVLRPHTPVAATGFDDKQADAVRTLLAAYLDERQISDYSLWLYTPMALPLIMGLNPRAIAYDCMDELGAFRGAAAQLSQREARLLAIANVTFTGGPGLFAAKRGLSASLHCQPSSVDVGHFAAGRDATRAHPALAELGRPRLGFFGVIDERFDTALIAHVARARPDWEICLVGPVVKIAPESLPRAPNIHYFGQQRYEDLPAFLAGWDICLMPFALNASTRFISPTKTLEYMAAGKAVVSTAIADVQTLYSCAVRIAVDADDFVEGCTELLAETASQREERLATMHKLTRATSWQATADAMASLLRAAEENGPTAEALAYLASEQVVAIERTDVPDNASIVIIGAGPTGLSAAYHLGSSSVLIERNKTVGGWCRSVFYRGFQFDCAGHIMFSKDPYVHAMYQRLLGENIHWQDREAWVYSNGVHTRYPFQGSLHGLPSVVLKECIMGAIEARYGQATAPVLAAAPLVDCCADGVAPDHGSHVQDPIEASAGQGENFEQFIYRVWGAGVAKHFAIPYNRKLWAVPLSDMETSWLGGRVPLPDLDEMIEGALSPKPKPMGPNARFGYPLKGGFQALMDGFLPLLEGELLLGSEVVRVNPSTKSVHLDDGRAFRYEQLISTLPLPALIRAIGDEAPAAVHAAAAALRRVSVRCVNLGIGRPAISEKHWIYYPGDTVFHRVFLQGNASPHANPAGGFGLTCEISYSPLKPLPCEGSDLVDLCIADCIRVGLINEDDPIWASGEVDMPYAYVVYDHQRAKNVDLLRSWLRAHDIHLAGRYSEWEYYNSDHAFVAGKRVAHEVATLMGFDRARSA